MALLDDVKVTLRISNTAYDGEITDLISAVQQDLILSGVISEKANDDTDPLIKRAVSSYVKANFGWNNADAERLQKSYDLLKMHLSMSIDYNSYTIIFNIKEGINLVEDAVIIFNEEIKETDETGVAVFKGIKEGVNQEYTVTKTGYAPVQNYLDITATANINVELVVF